MKTMMLVFATMFLGCMAEWQDTPKYTTTFNVDTSTSIGQDMNVGQDTTGIDADPTKVDCNTPSKIRLVPNGDGTWKDLLLDLDCQFLKTAKGKKCLPGTLDDQWAMKDWPMPTTQASVFFQSSDCKSNRVWLCHQDNKGRIPRFGVINDGTGIIPMVFNLDRPAPNTVVSIDPITAEVAAMTGVHMATYLVGAIAECNPYSDVTTVPPKPFNRVEKGIASIPQCPFMTGLDLFADMPL